MIRDVHVFLDDSALVAAGSGNVLASRLIHRAHAEQGWFLYATVCALVEADRARPGTAEHLAALPGIVTVDLDLPAALSVARATTWADAHTLYAAQPSPDRPDGALIATIRPHTWKEQPARTLDLSP
ncbi:hypothetical protein SAMN05444521_4190 [Streptomyces sp. 3214.6]|nr:hypothetical protein [Streptomyces sp. 3214.6]SHI12416.1 hypothetical protein SAMN05444521_4190 [Streptomyces sp. 3214.6]